MTRLEAFRRIVTTPRDHVDQGRIGYVQKFTKADGRERITLVFQVMRFTKRRTA